MSFLESYCISSRFCTSVLGSTFYSPTPPDGGCGWYLEHGAYSAVGKREITCLWGVGVLGWGTFTDLVFAHMADAAQRNLWGGCGSYM